jgi:tripartite-type tricarboxylate transporter receptor subunit TctC
MLNVSAGIRVGLLAASMALLAGNAHAQTYPNGQVRLIVPTPAGGVTDTMARIVAQRLGETLNQTVIVDNRPGGNGGVGASAVERSPADGLTLLVTSDATITANPYLSSKLSYDAKAFTPIMVLCRGTPVLVVNAAVPVKSTQELIALAKSKPATLNYASSGAGGIVHLGTEYFKSLAGVDIVHIPYKGGNTAHNDIIAGFVQVYFGTVLSTLPVVKSGKVRALGVSTEKRNPALPDVPAVGETVKGFAFSGWYAVLAPQKTPKDVTALLNREITALLRAPEMSARLAADGSTVVASTPEQLTEHLKRDIAKWARVVKAADIRLDATR